MVDSETFPDIYYYVNGASNTITYSTQADNMGVDPYQNSIKIMSYTNQNSTETFNYYDWQITDGIQDFDKDIVIKYHNGSIIQPNDYITINVINDNGNVYLEEKTIDLDVIYRTHKVSREWLPVKIN